MQAKNMGLKENPENTATVADPSIFLRGKNLDPEMQKTC